MKLYKHQQKTVEIAKDKWGLWFRMRVGKTATAIRLITTRAKSGLVVSPKSLVKNWEKEINNWGEPGVKIDVISREQFKIHIKSLDRYDAIVFDECHRGFGNYKSQMFKSASWYINTHKIKFVWLLSGTPFTATSWSIYSYGKLLGKDWKWFDWDRRYFFRRKMGRRSIPMPKAGMEKELQTILRRIGTVIDLKDVAEVGEDININEYFSLNLKQRDYIKNIDADLPIVRYGQQHQLESGIRKSDGYNEELSFLCSKDKRLLELVEDNPKIVIIARYLAQIEKYKKLFKKYKVYTISGQEKLTASEVAEQAEKEKECIVLIQSDTSDGYSLQSFNTMVFTSMSYSFVNYDQIKYRMKNINNPTANTYIHFITDKDSIDKAVYDSVIKKQNFSLELYAQKKERS